MSKMYIYGVHPVEELLERMPERIDEIAVASDLKDGRWAQIRSALDEVDAPTRRVSSQELDRLAEGGNHQGIAAGVSSYPYRHLDDIVEELASRPGHRCIVALAQIQDPGNLGAILRSCAGLGADAVVIPKHRAAHMTSAVIRASAGMAFYTPVVRVTNLSRALRTLKDEGWWVVGTVADEAQPLWEMDWKLDSVVVMGGEHKGMRPGVEKECDFRVTIPLPAEVESLNVASAASVVLYDRMSGLNTDR